LAIDTFNSSLLANFAALTSRIEDYSRAHTHAEPPVTGIASAPRIWRRALAFVLHSKPSLFLFRAPSNKSLATDAFFSDRPSQNFGRRWDVEPRGARGVMPQPGGSKPIRFSSPDPREQMLIMSAAQARNLAGALQPPRIISSTSMGLTIDYETSGHNNHKSITSAVYVA